MKTATEEALVYYDCKVSKFFKLRSSKFARQQPFDVCCREFGLDTSRLDNSFNLLKLQVSVDTADSAVLINNDPVTIEVEELAAVQYAGVETNKNGCGSSLKKFMKRYCIFYMREYEGQSGSNLTNILISNFPTFMFQKKSTKMKSKCGHHQLEFQF